MRRSVAIGVLAALAPVLARADALYVPPKSYPVHVHLAGDRAGLRLQLLKSNGAFVCLEPCDQIVQTKEYERFRIQPDNASAGVTLVFEEIPPLALSPEHGSVSIEVVTGHPERRVGAAFTLGASGTLFLLGSLAGAAGAGVLSTHPADETPARIVRNSGFISAAAGAVAALIGLLVFANTPPPRATVTAE